MLDNRSLIINIRHSYEASNRGAALLEKVMKRGCVQSTPQIWKTWKAFLSLVL